ncbi:Ornithine carbamoyltransferase [Natranaerofaba carboxydovora]|nr:ornithine carbamoyltransferase [Natranaerofaba carboxydovora]UMZ74566.1 Ornithine carbamoyltransferase [Natranaerofaba carboxydovora]
MAIDRTIESLKGRDFLTLKDFGKEELESILDLSSKIKKEQKQGTKTPYLAGKTLGMLFEKPSTRTRVSFEVAIHQLGGMGLFLSSNDLQLKRGEPIKDTARVLSGYLDGIMVRTFSHDTITELSDYSSVPVINGLTDLYHPCQVMADLLTIKEEFDSFSGLSLTYLGDGKNNMAHSLLYGCSKMGINITIGAPKKYFPREDIVNEAKEIASKQGSKIKITDDPAEAVAESQVLYTDVWVSMGDEAEKEERLKDLTPFQLNDDLLAKAHQDAIVLHCLPAHRDEEITDSVMEGKKSRVFVEAENRLHAQKGILVSLMMDGGRG